jgi:hypothetical protein
MLPIKNYKLSINMNLKYYVANYLCKLTIFIFPPLILLCCFTSVFATNTILDDRQLDIMMDQESTLNTESKSKMIYDQEEQINTSLADFPNYNLVKYLPSNKLDRDIFYSLDRILHKDNFDLINSRWWLLKALLYAPTPFFCGANTLIIDNRIKMLTVQLILAAQFTVPRTIESLCNLTDQLRLAIFEKRLKIWFKEEVAKNYCYGTLRMLWMLCKLSSCAYLGYAYSIIDAKTAGDAYRWMYESTTSNEKTLDVHDNVGYFFNFSYTAMLGAIFFFQLIDEFEVKGGFILRNIYNYCRGKTTKNQDLEYEQLVKTISDLRTKTALICSYDNSLDQIDFTIEEYLSDRGLNSMTTIASLQKYLGSNYNPRGFKYHITSNIFKLFFIAGATVLCGISFKYIFASATILRNYVNSVGEKQNNGSYLFNLKDNGTFLCDSVRDCTEGVDFNKIYLSDNQKNKLLDFNKEADIANILQGVGISSDTAVLILNIISFSSSMMNSYLHRRAFKINWMQNNRIKKSKIISLVGAALILPAMVFYLENVNNVRPVAKNANRLLETTGESIFIPVDLGIVSTLVVLGATFALGARLLSNLPYAIWSIPKKVRGLPISIKKTCTDISRSCK